MFRLPILATCLGLTTPLLAEDFHNMLTHEPDHAGQDHRAVVPEPMVFDLVRPLGVRKGELEINVLAIHPLTRRRTGSTRAGDELGLTPLSRDRRQTEWAPEIEWAPFDDFAVEFELPFEGSKLEEIKLALQWTFDSPIEDRYMHGFQGLMERTLDTNTTAWTGLYLGAYRFNDRWSMLGMTGLSHETGPGVGGIGGDRTQILNNLNLFYDVNEHWVLGFEINHAISMDGDNILLLMPQAHFEFHQNWCLQFGAGAGFSTSETLPQAAIRLIWTQ